MQFIAFFAVFFSNTFQYNFRHYELRIHVMNYLLVAIIYTGTYIIIMNIRTHKQQLCKLQCSVIHGNFVLLYRHNIHIIIIVRRCESTCIIHAYDDRFINEILETVGVMNVHYILQPFLNQPLFREFSYFNYIISLKC